MAWRLAEDALRHAAGRVPRRPRQPAGGVERAPARVLRPHRSRTVTGDPAGRCPSSGPRNTWSRSTGPSSWRTRVPPIPQERPAGSPLPGARPEGAVTEDGQILLRIPRHLETRVAGRTLPPLFRHKRASGVAAGLASALAACVLMGCSVASGSPAGDGTEQPTKTADVTLPTAGMWSSTTRSAEATRRPTGCAPYRATVRTSLPGPVQRLLRQRIPDAARRAEVVAGHPPRPAAA